MIAQQAFKTALAEISEKYVNLLSGIKELLVDAHGFFGRPCIIRDQVRDFSPIDATIGIDMIEIDFCTRQIILTDISERPRDIDGLSNHDIACYRDRRN